VGALPLRGTSLANRSRAVHDIIVEEEPEMKTHSGGTLATILSADRDFADRPATDAGSIEDAWLTAYARGGPIAGALPTPEKEAPGVEIGSFSLSAHAGACDVHDVFRVSEDTLALVIADTWCVGAPRGALSTFTRSMVRDLCSISRSPEEAVARLGRMLCDARLEAVIVTLFLGWLDLRAGRLQHANAGHPHPLRVTLGGEVRSFGEVTGPSLGVEDGAFHAGGIVTLEPGETAILYTDGVVESRGAARRFLGDKGLADILMGHAARPAAAICDAVAREITPDPGGPRDEDATILAVRWEGPPTSC
jgi:serine phosphatase RsbU (regulator of sigma subunit)